MKAAKVLGWVLVILGIWEAYAPFAWGYAHTPGLVQALVAGALWAAFGLWIALSPRRDAVAWLGWLSVLVGAWLVFAPAILGYASASAALWNDVLVGFIGMVVSAWAAFYAPELPAPEAPQVEHH